MTIFNPGVVESTERWAGRALSFLGGLLVALVVYGVIAVRFSAQPLAHPVTASLFAAFALMVWHYCQRDNERAARANDKTLIVSTFTQDTLNTFALVGAVAFTLGFAGVAPAGVLIAAPLAAFAGYSVWQHIWRQVK